MPQYPLLVPELAEVYLLFDNIAAVASKTVPDLGTDPVFVGGQGTWVQQVCAIRWPPPPSNTPQDNAQCAAKLLKARDALNAAAQPATGSSIAFTLMLAGDAPSRRSGRPWWKNLLGIDRDEPEEPVFDNPSDRLFSGKMLDRRSLAGLAYPLLSETMGRYRFRYRFVRWFLFFALVLTCLLSWDVVAGTALLNRVDSLHTIQGPILADKRVGGKPMPPPADTAAKGSAATDPTVPRENLGHWMAANTWLSWLFGGWNEVPIPPSSDRPPAPAATNVEWASVMIGVLAGTILPICYGILGASTAVVRNVIARIAANTLLPRDLTLAIVLLGLGAVIGACVGLFVTPGGNGAAGQNGLLGPVQLSSAALCFLAGFGVEGVFRALEALVKRVFPAAPVP